MIAAQAEDAVQSSPPQTSAAKQDTAKTEAQSASTWKVGIAKFELGDEGGVPTILATTLPRLMIADLRDLPLRRTPPEEAREAFERKRAQARYAAGAELAAKLDARAQGFLSPAAEGAEKNYNIYSADKAVKDSAANLDKVLKDETDEKGAVDQAPSTDLSVELWAGHAQGKLIDPPGDDLPKAAKAAAVDFLVTGSVYKVGAGYAAVVVKGFDAALGRQVFSEKSYCSFDDPEPVALEMAEMLEHRFAGRDYARLELSPEPAGAELFVNGRALAGSSRTAYLYEPGPVHVSASAPGYKNGATDVLVALGEKKSVAIKLDAAETGHVALTTDPAGASVSVDSAPVGNSPLDISLDGSRKILVVSAEGMEPETVVLPASGESSISLKLQPSSGTGPADRIAAAKDSFYWAFGWFVLSVPITTLTIGYYNEYEEAYQRSGSSSLGYSSYNASIAIAAASALTATATVVMIIRLVKYLKTVR
jgi:hypothetical protein